MGGGLFHFPQAPGAGFFISLKRRARTPFAWLRATRAARSRRPGRFAARFPSLADTASVSVWRGRALRPLGPEGWRGNADGAGVERGAGLYRDRDAQQPGRRDRAARRMARSQASGASARRLREMNKFAPGNRRGVGHDGNRTAGPERATARRAERRVGKRAERAPAVEGNEKRRKRTSKGAEQSCSGRLPPLRSLRVPRGGAVSHAAHDDRCGACSAYKLFLSP